MATRKKSLAKRGGRSMVDIRKKMQDMAKQQEERLKGSEGNFISIQDGQFVHGDEVLPQPMPVVILDQRHVNAYYPEAYDADKRQSPICYAISNDPDELAPHEDCEDPQAETCAQCWANEYKSDDRGKGKACRNTIRIAVTPSEKMSASSEVALMSIPPTSLKIYRGYVKRYNNVTGLPSMGYATELSTEPLGGGKIGHKLKPEFVQELDDAELEAAYALFEQCQEDLEVQFMKADDVEETKPARRKATKKRVAKKAPAKKKTTAKKKTPRRRF